MAYADSAPCPSIGQSLLLSGRFAQVEHPIIADRRLTDLDVRIFTAYAMHRNAVYGMAWPRYKTIAIIVGCHVDSVGRSVARLEKCNWLVRVADGRGRGHSITFRFPAADLRQQQQQRREAQAEDGPKPKRRKARTEKKPDRSVGARTEGFEKNPPQTPPLEPASVEPETSRGEIPAAQPPEIAAENAPEARQAPEKAKPAPTQRLAFPEGLAALVCVQLGKMLSSTPEAVAQEMLDEMAYNARCHNINSPCAYIRRLLNLHRQGEFSPEVAHFERERRKRQKTAEAIRQNNERLHLEALAEGRLPSGPPKAPIVRTPEDEAIANAYLAEMRAMLSMKPSPYKAAPS